MRSLVIAGEFPFPEGNASATRIRHLAEGFKECGLQVHVISLWPQPVSPGSQPGGLACYNHIQYENLNECMPRGEGTLQLRNDTVGRKLRWFFWSYRRASAMARHVHRLATASACDLLIVYGRSFVRLWPAIQAAHRAGKPVIWDATEGPSSFTGFMGALNPIGWDWRLASLLLPKRVDAATVVCEPLLKNLQRHGLSQGLIVPHIEEFDHLPHVTAGNPDGEFHLLYLGALLARDHPQMMLQILRELVSRSLRVCLWIAGKYEQTKEGRAMERWIQRNSGLCQQLRFLGMPTAEQLDRLRDRAHGFILLRRNCQAERESFPTRLVEFLKAGKPAFVSNVGDIGNYLQDDVHATLLDPEDSGKAALALARVIKRDDKGMKMGLRGQAQAARCFNRTIHARRIIEFATPLAKSLTG